MGQASPWQPRLLFPRGHPDRLMLSGVGAQSGRALQLSEKQICLAAAPLLREDGQGRAGRWLLQHWLAERCF